jgi:hypothetical protein
MGVGAPSLITFHQLDGLGNSAENRVLARISRCSLSSLRVAAVMHAFAQGPA